MNVHQPVPSERPGVAPIRPADFLARARGKLLSGPPSLTGADDPLAGDGDHSLNPGHLPADFARQARAAAVLIPAVAHEGGMTLLLTQRADNMRNHGGQVAFPGGKIDDDDDGALGAALREAQEEIGLEPSAVTPLGYLSPYLTGSGYRILPVVGFLQPGFSLTLNPVEVADAFETPLDFLMDVANHERRTREWRGRERAFYAMPYGERNIWGVTAGIIRQLYDRMYGP